MAAGSPSPGEAGGVGGALEELAPAQREVVHARRSVLQLTARGGDSRVND